jgi:hypothetical protein
VPVAERCLRRPGDRNDHGKVLCSGDFGFECPLIGVVVVVVVGVEVEALTTANSAGDDPEPRVARRDHRRQALPLRTNRVAGATQVASVLQASGFRADVTVFRLNARLRPKTGSDSAFRRNTAARVYRIEAAHNPEVAGSNPAPATEKGPGNRAFFLWITGAVPIFASV